VNTTPDIAARLQGLVRAYNRELALDAFLKALLGVVFSVFTFGFLFCVGWMVGFMIGGLMDLEAWQCGAILSGLFFVVAVWSAWRQVDPTSGLERLSDRQQWLTLITQAAPTIDYFSGRHAAAGAAVVLIGGPANVFRAFAIWGCRIRADASLIDEAAQLLAQCRANYPAEEVVEPAAAVLLRRLGLIKVVTDQDSAALALTRKGSAVLEAAASN
jgi:hypothetical protein